MTLSRVTERAKEVAKEPPRAWRNKWRVQSGRNVSCGRCGWHSPFLAPWSEVVCDCTFPSKEMAENHAATYVTPQPYVACEYLGAFPIGPA
jgi:hypothetical protein